MKTVNNKTKKSNFIIITCFYLNVLIAVCSCAFYAGATKKHEENMRIKNEAAQIFDFPDIKKENGQIAEAKKKRSHKK